ncbi:MAG TPA: ABC transporter transmembrane domain-containing protein [Streptosporangiaceae bacterium]|jgi:ATP-binding cassette subfamily B protein
MAYNWRAMHSFTRDRGVAHQELKPGTVRRVLSYARPHRLTLATFLGITSLDAVVVVTVPLLLRGLIDDGVLPGDIAVVLGIAAVVAGLALLDALLSIGGRWLSSKIGEGLIYDLRTQVFRHVQRQPIAFFTRAQTGSLVSRLNSDVIGAQQALTSTLSSVVSNVLSLLLVLAVMVSLSWLVTVVALVLLPAFIIPARLVGRRLQRLSRESMQLDAAMGTTMTERFNVAGAMLVKLYGRPEEEADVFARRAGRVRDIGVVTAIYGGALFVALTLLASLATAVTYGLGGTLVIHHEIQLGSLVALAALLGRLYGPITGLSNVQVDVMTALVSFDRVFEVLDLKPLIEDRPGAVPLRRTGEATGPDPVALAGSPGLAAAQSAAPTGPATANGSATATGSGPGNGSATANGSPTVNGSAAANRIAASTSGRDGTAAAPPVSFDHVTFRYPMASEVSLASLESIALPGPEHSEPGRNVLTDVSFDAPAGQLTALVGPSGAGKTTITHLVSRLYDPLAGAVRIGGQDLRDVTQASLHDVVGVVTQDAHLFHDTIRANLAYARPDASEADLVEACRAAQIWDLIGGLPDGLDTVVGDRGYRLSGGEKQRIALARLLLKAPSVVVLDEATAHLDSESEAAVQRALRTALTGRTSLVIAHRLSTIREADQILVIDDGQVRERGRHAELLAAGGLYAELYHTQFAGQEAARA